MTATSVNCIKCGLEAMLLNREVQYGEEQIPYVGPVNVPRIEIIEIDCPKCGHYRSVRKYDEPFR